MNTPASDPPTACRLLADLGLSRPLSISWKYYTPEAPVHVLVRLDDFQRCIGDRKRSENRDSAGNTHITAIIDGVAIEAVDLTPMPDAVVPA